MILRVLSMRPLLLKLPSSLLIAYRNARGGDSERPRPKCTLLKFAHGKPVVMSYELNSFSLDNPLLNCRADCQLYSY